MECYPLFIMTINTPEKTLFVSLKRELSSPPIGSQEQKLAILQNAADAVRDKFIEWAKGIDQTYDPDIEMGAFRQNMAGFPVTNPNVIQALENNRPEFVDAVTNPENVRISLAEKDEANVGASVKA